MIDNQVTSTCYAICAFICPLYVRTCRGEIHEMNSTRRECQGSLERGSTPFPVSGAAPDGAEHGTNVSFAGIRDLG